MTTLNITLPHTVARGRDYRPLGTYALSPEDYFHPWRNPYMGLIPEEQHPAYWDTLYRLNLTPSFVTGTLVESYFPSDTGGAQRNLSWVFGALMTDHGIPAHKVALVRCRNGGGTSEIMKFQVYYLKLLSGYLELECQDRWIEVRPDSREDVAALAAIIKRKWAAYDTDLEATRRATDLECARPVLYFHGLLDAMFSFISRDYSFYDRDADNYTTSRVLSAEGEAKYDYTVTSYPTASAALTYTFKKKVDFMDKSRMHRLFSYSTNVLDYIPGPQRLKGELDDTPLYGVELELATDYEVRDIIESVKNPFFICKQDSSISGSKINKYELVTTPASFKMHRVRWAEFFHNMDMAKFDTSRDTTNGMHVHIGRETFWGPSHIRKFCWFITQPANSQFMLAFSERDKRSFDAYTPLPNYSAASPTRAMIHARRYCEGLRGAVNLSKSQTIEVRLFRGIVFYAEMLKNLEFVDAVLEWTRHVSYANITLMGFLDWLSKTPRSQYKMLKTYLEHMNYDKMLANSRIFALIQSDTDPDIILSKINSTTLEVDNDVVDLINEKLGKKFFKLGADKKLVLIYSNKSKLHSLDKQLVSRIYRPSAA